MRNERLHKNIIYSYAWAPRAIFLEQLAITIFKCPVNSPRNQNKPKALTVFLCLNLDLGSSTGTFMGSSSIISHPRESVIVSKMIEISISSGSIVGLPDEYIGWHLNVHAPVDHLENVSSSIQCWLDLKSFSVSPVF